MSINRFRHWVSAFLQSTSALASARRRKASRIVEGLEERVLLSAFAEFADPNPAPGNQFGAQIIPLSSGNVIVTSPYDDAGGVDAGAVYLFNGSSGSLISALTGGHDNDNVGSGTITVLGNGNFLVSSFGWDNGAAVDAGAVTFGSGTTGVSGVLGPANSLVGSKSGDSIGSGGISILTNGNFLVQSPSWDNGAVVDASALTFGSATTGISGVVGSANSLVGAKAGDSIGDYGIYELTNGDFIIRSSSWDGASAADVGALTWASGTAGVTGVVNSTTSLVGTTNGGNLAYYSSITELTNGNFLVVNPNWDNGATLDVGAVTFGSGTTGVTGVVGSGTSLVGSTTSDAIGSGGITELSNGSYLVRSPSWDNGATPDVGAFTWGSGTTGVKGAVSIANSLVGTAADNVVNTSTITELGNGNFLVTNPTWDNGAATDAGAVTFGSGTTGVKGVVSDANSLVGGTTNDLVGSDYFSYGGGITVLSNSSYVVRSPSWDNTTTGATDAGAVTWGSGTAGVKGVVSATNSLVGSSTDDRIGDINYYGYGHFTVLSNGNYLVRSLYWDNTITGATDAGAVTWGSATAGVKGVISATNSLIGSTTDDRIGDNVTILTNDNYIVQAPNWDNGAATNAGAVTWGSGTTGVKGVIGTANSLIGSTAEDRVGDYVTVLSNDNYIVRTPYWDKAAAVDVGAVTWGSGTLGVKGAISATNSLTGNKASDYVGYYFTLLSNENYIVQSPDWDNGLNADAGAVTWGSATAGVSGLISAANSLVGSKPNDRIGDTVTVLSNDNYVVRAPYWDNGLVTDAGAVTWGSGTAGVLGVISAGNSLIGSTAYDIVGSGFTLLSNDNYVVQSPNWDNGALVDVGAVTWGSATAGVKDIVSASNSLVGTADYDYVGYGLTALTNNHYVVQSPYWDNGAATDAGAVTWASGATGIVGPVSVLNSLVGAATSDTVGISGVTALGNGNYLVHSPNWDNGAATDAGALTWSDGSTGIQGLVSETNSLVGGISGNNVGSGTITVLASGNFLVSSFGWDNGAAVDAGAVTFGSGTTGVSGVLGPANSLVGSKSGDSIGSGGISILTNGNFLVQSPSWDNGAVVDASALTFGSATTGISGVVGSANSLVGAKAGDSIGDYGIYELTNGDFIIRSSSWDGASAADVGALTWASGTAGVTGVVNSTTSLVGTTNGGNLAYYSSITELTNGNFLVVNPNWDNGATLDVGAVTFGSGTTGVTGVVGSGTSLVGSTTSDAIGSGGITELSNGSYLVRSPSWDNGATPDVGAFTWGSGTTGVKGAVSIANSLVGTAADNVVNTSTITELGNGNFLVTNPTWDNGAATDAGAVTFGSGTTGVKGVVSDANSLVGGTTNDLVGSDYFSYGGGITVLSNSSYVVRSPSWDNTTTGATDAGAVTWGSGTAGVKGVVSATNSLVGSSTDDRIGDINYYGYGHFTVLSNGNYLVRSLYWDNTITGATDAGAVTWGSATAGVKGVISATNSLIGSTTDDRIGDNVTILTNDNYIVQAPNWDNGAATNAGAVTWGSGTTGVKGVIGTANSLIGSTAEDRVGDYVTVLSNDNYIVRTPYWDKAAAVDVGAVTWGSGTLGVKGAISATNSLTGNKASDYVGYYFTLLSNENYIVQSPDWDNGLNADAGAVTWGSATAGVSGLISAANSLVGSKPNDRIGDTVTVLSNDNYVVRAPYWDNGLVTDAGAVTWGSGTAGVLGVISAGNSLIGSTAYDYIGSYLTVLSNNNYVVQSPNWDNGALVDVGAVTWGSATRSVKGAVSEKNSLIGLIDSTNLQQVVLDAVNNTYYSPFLNDETGGRIRVSSQNGWTFNESGGLLTIVGTTADDDITVLNDAGTIMIIANGLIVSTGMAAASITRVTCSGLNGDDTLTMDVSLGSALPGTLLGGDGNDTLNGGLSRDILEGGAGNDTLNGGSSHDVYVFDTDTQLDADSIIDIAGIDWLTFAESTNDVTVNLGLTTAQIINANLTLTLNSGTSIEKITGGSGNDTLTGNTLGNTLDGRGGSDLLDGGSGNDIYEFDTRTQLDADSITDSAGIDRLSFTSSTNDVSVNLSVTTSQIVNSNLSLTLVSAVSIEDIYGGYGNDTLIGNTLNNLLDGGAGNDWLDGADGSDILQGRAGDDTLIGGGGADKLYGGAGLDVLDGGSGNDIYEFDTRTQLDADSITDSAGIDRLSFTSSTNDVSVNLSVTTSQIVNSNLSLTLVSAVSIEDIYGGYGNDTLIGNTLNNLLDGGAGNDWLDGADGSDILQGRAGDDTLIGGGGADKLYGGAGLDVLDGGSGNDIYEFDTRTQLDADSITDSAGIDRLSFTSSTNDVSVNLSVTTSQIVNSNLSLTLVSAVSIEDIYGGYGNDTLIGNTLNNLLDGGAGNDWLDGADGSDILQGRAGDDTLIGGGGADKLYGGAGLDVLDGGSGNDIYEFDTRTQLDADSITDSAGIDRLSFTSSTNDVSVNLSVTTSQIVNSNLSLTLVSAVSIEDIYGGYGNDTLIGNTLNNLLDGGAGNDLIIGNSGDDRLNGGLGVDTVSYVTSGSSVNVNLTTKKATGGTGNDSLNGFENVVGSNFNDYIKGDANNNTLDGLDGIDDIFGGGGVDVILNA
jgi:Ca2+-binding RTX toxin-like protein